MGALGLVVGSIFDIASQVIQFQSARAIVDSPTAVPVKVAHAVPPTDTSTPTNTPTSTRKPVTTSTRTATPTRKPTRVADSTSTPTLANTVAALAARVAITGTATPTATAPTAVVQIISAPVTTGEGFGLLPVLSPQTDRAAARQADLNLAMRGAVPVSATLALIDYEGDTDGGAPQLARLFGDSRSPIISAAFQVYGWDWNCDCRGPIIDDPGVTLVGIKTTPGEIMRVPSAGSEIGNGYQVLVLYADPDRITLKYTRSDSVKDGYTVHVESVAVDSSLLVLYRQSNGAGRSELPALRAGQSFAKAEGSEIRVAIRDTGTFMDPRSRKDWWRGY